MKNLKKTLSIAFVSIPATILCSVFLAQFDTHALSPSDFQAGNIINDAVMTNKKSLTSSQIQTFLNSKVPSCDTSGLAISEYGGPDLNGDGKVQRWEWGKANYNQTVFTCLKDYQEGGKSSAQIIYDTSQEFNINPQVLIVLLQKEQALVTDTWPLDIQYRSATGYGCPDTADCNADYYGFTKQVRWAATMYNAIMTDSPTWYTPYNLGANYIQYNPSSSCGGSNVNIKNRATQALYNYTPYQPNSATLSWKFDGAAYPSCGAFGNLNFFVYFTTWFGSTQGTPFFQINGSAKIYILGANNNYYYAPNWETMSTYGWGVNITRIASYDSSYLSGRSFSGPLSNLARFESAEVYLIDGGFTHLFPSRALLTDYGRDIGDEVALSVNDKSYFQASTEMTSIAKDKDSKYVYLVSGGKKRHFAGPSAYNLGTPAYSSLASVTVSDDFLKTVRYGAPIYRLGTLIQTEGTTPIYMINSLDEKVYIGSRFIMEDLGLSFNNLIKVNSLQAAAYPTSLVNITNFVKDENDNIFCFTSKGEVLNVSSTLSDASHYNIDVSSLVLLNSSNLIKPAPSAQLTQLIRGADGKVYLVENGSKTHVVSPSALYAQGFSFDDVTNVSNTLINSIPSS